MTKVFHARLNGRFTNIKHNVSKRKLHKTMQGSNFLRGDLIKTVQEPPFHFRYDKHLKRLIFPHLCHQFFFFCYCCFQTKYLIVVKIRRNLQKISCLNSIFFEKFMFNWTQIALSACIVFLNLHRFLYFISNQSIVIFSFLFLKLTF